MMIQYIFSNPRWVAGGVKSLPLHWIKDLTCLCMIYWNRFA